MRILLMLLVLANLGFFAWQHWYGADDVRLPAGRADTSLGKGLQLVSESVAPLQEEAPAAAGGRDEEPPEVSGEVLAVEETPAPEAAQPAIATCATLGPFDRLEAAEVVQSRLAAPGAPAVVRESGGQIRSGFWVYLPPFSSRAAAKQVEDELREKAVSDLFIVTGSEQRNAISLGLFSTPERADQRAAEIGRLGYTPRVAERFRDATVYWVDFRERLGDPLEPESVGVLGAADMLPEKRSIPCSDIAVDAVGP